MDTAGIRFGKVRTGKFKIKPGNVQIGDIIGITKMLDGDCYIQHNDNQILAEPIDANARYCVEDTCQFPNRVINWILSIEANGKITIQSHRFAESILLSNSMKIGVTDRALSFIRKDHQGDPLTFIQDHFVFGNYSFCSMGDRDIKQTGGFKIVGAGYVLHVAKQPQNIWLVSKMSKLSSNKSKSESISLVKPSFTFTIESEANQNADFNSSQLDQIVHNANGYLSIWEQYNTLEENNIRKRFQELGRLRYCSVRYVPKSDGRRIEFELSIDAPDVWIEGELFDIEVLPVLKDLSDDPFARSEVPSVHIGAMISVRGQTITAELDDVGDQIPEEGFLQLSVSGDAPRIRRREFARNRILQGNGEIPHLLNILEETDFRIIQTGRRQDPLDAELTTTMNPNDGQREALDVALNTPDIAIIQGPPGTGKTRVIKALVHRLYELNKDNPQFGILISSYQHDAVDNAVKGLVVAGMPAVRYGGRRGATMDFQDEIRIWIEDKVKELRVKAEFYRENELYSIYRDLSQVFNHWRITPGGVSGTRKFLLNIENVCSVYLNGEWLQRFHELHGVVSSFGLLSEQTAFVLTDVESKRLEELLQLQRITVKAFEDDGAFAAARLARFIKSWTAALPPEWIPQIELAATWEVIRVSDRLEEFQLYQDVIGQLKKWVQTPNQQNNLGQADVPHPMVERFCVELLNDLKKNLSQTSYGYSDALDDYMDSLQSDPEITRKMLRRYSVVAASTCQQSAQKEIEQERQSFDVVIIDEAARANPLDLFIPMVKGRKVILVGDQAQLPHVLERDIERDLMKSDGVTQDVISISLFERMFEYLTDLEKTSGIRRTARLDTQYRMHRKIADFVADQFYDYKIDSEVDDEKKSHGLPLFAGKPMAWIDVPHSLGVESGRQSYFRPVEIKVLFDQLVLILEASEISPDGNPFTVGIITFYKSQVKKLMDEMDRRVFPEHWIKRIRIGTVDAFQGREFDAVLLSTVRSNTHTSLRRRVGFLELRNRLNVAFSRAQKLLVVIGDSETVAGTEDQACIPSLHKFHQICKREDGYYERCARL